jgi:hypothetical protein
VCRRSGSFLIGAGSPPNCSDSARRRQEAGAEEVTRLSSRHLPHKDLRIRSYTPAATGVFNLLPADRGRPITDFSSHIALPELGRDIAKVLAAGEPVERRVEHVEAPAHYLARLAPYRKGNRNLDGVVVTLREGHQLDGG